MALADDIGSLRNRTLAELDAAHDYFVDTKIAWRLVRNIVKTGHKFSVRNAATGSVTSEADLAAKARDYVNRGIANTTYESKAGTLARYKAGDKIEISEQYHRATWQLVRKLVTEIASGAIARLT